MIVIPAIDLKDGRCVRLKQGRMSEETVYSTKPEEIALKWFEKGAERLHVVDLDGAIRKTPVHREVVRHIVKAVPIPVEVGGGIRNIDTVRSYLDSGVHAVILGTAAFRDPDLLYQSCKEYPGRIILGLDANEGKIAVEGWTHATELTPIELGKRFANDGLEAIIYTDIQKDGMGTGPNIEATRMLAKGVNVPLIASGGIADVEDVKKVLTLSEDGVIGMITGRALYEGGLDLQEAIRIAKEKMQQKGA
ncbi:MAG: 1-(5-phosphoribosyl)-5-[(5-phosphoribosylamino)methylideneamino]imidazole-4-carboxamide isomerase [Deltaproteobacteria bacterium HGW-Deltaproteobacteria-21]|nr:MAG: 1-(5-phosphoribosyl)-5-[(5-phosphoribosylamino)methylideneamino]imidazole-4-carboxamide isomerase [Deltaproteobacteria bacterium HGW-Deltaproteobacteria-21]